MPDHPTGSPSRADDLAHELQVEIITGRIPLGTRLRQEDLAERFGVSRTPIREALRQLQAIGLVEQLGHRGALVRSFSPDECRNIFLVRAELEGLAAERASGRLTDLRPRRPGRRPGAAAGRRRAPSDATGIGRRGGAADRPRSSARRRTSCSTT